MLTTRSISWRTEVSRSGVPRWPRKYLLTTTLVASWLQKSGTSTSFCSKTRLARLVGDAGGPVLPGDLVVGMDVRAGPAALEGQAADRRLAVVMLCHRTRRRTGRRGGRRSWRLGRLLGLRGCRSMGCDRCPVPSSHLSLSSVVSDARCGVAAASRLRRCYRVVLGAAPGPADGAGGERVGRLGSISRPLERYAESLVDVNPKTTRCSGCSSVPDATCGGLGHPRSDRVRPRSGGVRPHARRRCPPVRAPVDPGCPRVVHRAAMVHPF